MTLILRNLIVLAVATIPLQVQAASIKLDETIIEFSASGSPNTITGIWGAAPMSMIGGTNIDYFTVELTSLISDFGSPQSISFDSFLPGNARSLSLCSNTVSCVADAVIGDVGTVDSSTAIFGAWDFLNRLVDGNNPQINSGQSTVAFGSGGGTASVSGQVLVQAYGEVAVVPIPPSAYLFGAGLLTILTLSRDRRCLISL